MGDIPDQSTSVHSVVQAKIISPTKIFKMNQQPIKIIKCGPENMQNMQSPNNATTEVLSLLKTILSKQESIEKRVEDVQQSVFHTEILISRHIIERSDILAENPFEPESRVKKRRTHSVERTPEEIEEETFKKIALEFPLETMDALLEMEQKLSEVKYKKSLVAYCKRFKDATNSVDKVLREIFADTLMKHFNWDGRCGKNSLTSLKLIDQVVFELFQIDGRKAFERNVKRYVELSHNRWKKKMSLEKKCKQRTNELLGYP